MKERLKKLEEFLEKHSKIMLIAIFVIGIIAYGFLAKKMTSPTFIDLDEELYVSMARSFFFDGNFAKNYDVLSYNCVLYSMIISIAYLFKPIHIALVMRFIGVLLMVSSIFPIYLLAKDILKSKSKAVMIAAFSLIIPEFLLSLYLVQEVLCYPMFLWIAYLVYQKFTKEKNIKIDIGLIILLATIFFVKSYAIVYAVAYFGTLLLINFFDKNYKECGKIILQGIACLGVIVITIVLIRLFNGEGVNHYSNQISYILPITLKKIIGFFYGIFYYGVCFLLCVGFLPAFVPILKMNKYSKEDRNFIIFLTLSTLITIIEVSLIVFVPEESEHLYPTKFCYRYLAPLFAPLFLMFLKCNKEHVKISKSMIVIYAISFVYLIWYYIGEEHHITAIDAPVLFGIQMLNNQEKLKGIAIFIISALTILSFGMIGLTKFTKFKDLKKIYIILAVLALIVIEPVLAIINVSMSNTALGGKMLKADFVTIADYIKRDYDRVYIVAEDETLSIFMRSYFGYSMSDFEVIKEKDGNKEIDIQDKKTAVLVANNFKGTIEGVNKTDIETTHIYVYEAEPESRTLKVEFKND